MCHCFVLYAIGKLENLESFCVSLQLKTIQKFTYNLMLIEYKV